MDKERIAQVTTRTFRAVKVGLEEFIRNGDGSWNDPYGEDIDDTVSLLLDAIVELNDLLDSK